MNFLSLCNIGRFLGFISLAGFLLTSAAEAQTSGSQKKGAKQPAKKGAGSSNQMPPGYPTGGAGGMQGPPPGSSMQPPPGYPTGGNGIPGQGDGKTPPPGSSLGTNFGAVPGYGSQPSYGKDNPPPGSSMTAAGLGGDKPHGYPDNEKKFDGPPPGSSNLFAPSYADDMQRKIELEARKRAEAEKAAAEQNATGMSVTDEGRKPTTQPSNEADNSSPSESSALPKMDSVMVTRIVLGSVLLAAFIGACVILGLVVTSMTDPKKR